MPKSLAGFVVSLLLFCAVQSAAAQSADLNGSWVRTINDDGSPSQGQAGGGQVADPNFKATVDNPAYKKGPKVLFDEAHNNFHTTGGRYKPFADLNHQRWLSSRGK